MEKIIGEWAEFAKNTWPEAWLSITIEQLFADLEANAPEGFDANMSNSME